MESNIHLYSSVFVDYLQLCSKLGLLHAPDQSADIFQPLQLHFHRGRFVILESSSSASLSSKHLFWHRFLFKPTLHNWIINDLPSDRRTVFSRPYPTLSWLSSALPVAASQIFVWHDPVWRRHLSGSSSRASVSRWFFIINNNNNYYYYCCCRYCCWCC